MAVDQLPGRVREFANYLNGLLARLDQAGGWCAVFWQRDPDGMQACLDGREIPPWDVLEALLQDLAAAYGPRAAAQEQERIRALHSAALLDHDARPGARDALGDRLDVMLREQRYAAERQAELSRLLASAATREEADALRLDLAWAHDDHERATARCAELHSRMAELDRRMTGGRAEATHRGRAGEGQAGEGHAGQGPVRWVDDTSAGGGGWGAREASAGDEGWDARDTGFPRQRGAYEPEWEAPAQEQPAQGRPGHDWPARDESSQDRSAHDWHGEDESGQDWPAQEQPAFDDPFAEQPAPADPSPAEPEPAPPAQKQRKRRRGSARFAGMAEADGAPVVVPPTAQPSPQAPAATGRRTPRGARFAGAGAGSERAKAQGKAQGKSESVDDGTPLEVVEAVGRLVRLRAEGRSGEAHALLVEAAYWPAARFPVLAAELHRAGLGADWATLLWEAASLPADRLVAAADALVAAGRDTDGEQILRQGVARPAVEVGQAVLELVAQGRRREVRALLDAYVRVRTPEEAARSAEPDPHALAPLLLEAAQGVSEERHWDLVHALRVAGFSA